MRVRGRRSAEMARARAGCRRGRRGADPFVELDWEEAVQRLADELKRVSTRTASGSSAAPTLVERRALHHAQSQCIASSTRSGYVRSVDTYSLGAARVAMPISWRRWRS